MNDNDDKLTRVLNNPDNRGLDEQEHDAYKLEQKRLEEREKLLWQRRGGRPVEAKLDITHFKLSDIRPANTYVSSHFKFLFTDFWAKKRGTRLLKVRKYSGLVIHNLSDIEVDQAIYNRTLGQILQDIMPDKMDEILKGYKEIQGPDCLTIVGQYVIIERTHEGHIVVDTRPLSDYRSLMFNYNMTTRVVSNVRRVGRGN